MVLKLDELCAQLDITKGHPPVDQWNPDLSGEIDIVIDAQGQWFHEGSLIERFELVKLFSSILRFEKGVGYCLVTPVEKWLLKVEDVPFLVKRYDILSAEEGGVAQAEQTGSSESLPVNISRLALTSNVDDLKVLTDTADWQLRDFQGVAVPYVRMRAELWARLSRPVYYRLIEEFEAVQGEQGLGITVGGMFLPLQ